MRLLLILGLLLNGSIAFSEDFNWTCQAVCGHATEDGIITVSRPFRYGIAQTTIGYSLSAVYDRALNSCGGTANTLIKLAASTNETSTWEHGPYDVATIVDACLRTN